MCDNNKTTTWYFRCDECKGRFESTYAPINKCPVCPPIIDYFMFNELSFEKGVLLAHEKILNQKVRILAGFKQTLTLIAKCGQEYTVTIERTKE